MPVDAGGVEGKFDCYSHGTRLFRINDAHAFLASDRLVTYFFAGLAGMGAGGVDAN